MKFQHRVMLIVTHMIFFTDALAASMLIVERYAVTI